MTPCGRLLSPFTEVLDEPERQKTELASNGPKTILVYPCLVHTECSTDISYHHFIIRKNAGFRVCLTQVQILACLRNRFAILGK